MKKKEISMEQKFQLIKFMDEGRWKGKSYGAPNYCRKDLPPQVKLLAHYLGYVTDRGISSKFVFETGDFIFSHLADRYTKETKFSVDDFLGLNNPESFFREKTPKDGKDLQQYEFFSSLKVSDTEEPCKNILKSNGFDDKNQVAFSSRFISNDYVAFWRILKNLDARAERNLVQYIQKSIDAGKKTNQKKIISVIYGLYLLGYKGMTIYSTLREKQQDELKLKKKYKYCFNKEIINGDSKKSLDSIENFFTKGEIPDSFFDRQKPTKECDIFKAKRVMCFVRDLFIPSFCDDFKKALNDDACFNELKDQLNELELPGDTWNNNSKFYKCLFEGTDEEKKFNEKKTENIKLNMLLRHIYEDGCKACTPVQFDVTFDFVRNMCENMNMSRCENVCPFNTNDGKIPIAFCHLEQKDKDHPMSFCHQKLEEKYCPFLLYACGYAAKCGDLKDCCPNRK